NGLNIPRVALLATGGGLSGTGTLDNWSAPVLANGCSSEHDEIRSIDSSPDGSYFVVATTGYKSAGGASICDAAARFETGATGTNVQPTWVNYAKSNGGLLVGTNVNSIGGVYHGQNAIFPLTDTAPQVPGGPIMSGIFSQGRLGGLDETTNGVAAMCVDDAGNSSAPGATIQL